MDLKNITTFLFDFDGVIADTESGRYEAYCDIFAERGIDLRSRCTMEDLAGHSGDGFISKYFPEIPSEQAREIVRQRQAYYMQHLDRFCRPYPGMKQTIREIREKGYYLALTTANSNVAAQYLLEKMEVSVYFDVICGREICEHPIRKVKDYSLVPAHIRKTVEECLVVEDSPVGVVGAKHAGFRCIAFEHFKNPIIGEMADAIVHNYTEFRSLIGLTNSNFETVRKNIKNTMKSYFYSIAVGLLCFAHMEIYCQTDAVSSFSVPFAPCVQMEKCFADPPHYARARAFWWWLEGYITKQGITDDLIAMQQAGIMGAIVFDAGSSGYYTGKASYHNTVLRTQPGKGFMTPEWCDLFAWSCRVADSLGMEISLNITSGWNDGGPWVTPDDASQKLVWSEISVEGGQLLDEQLPLPDGLLTFNGADKPYFRHVATLALQLAPDAETVKPLPRIVIKAIRSISIPQTSNGLGYDWQTLIRPLPDELAGCHARTDDVIDISRHVDNDGHVRWNVPDGRYVIMHFGHTGTGVKVSTHSPGAGGLAIDYMSAEATDVQFNHAVLPLIRQLRSYGSKSLRYLHDDSWELGAANWTPLMEKAFADINGYEIRKYLPVIAGKIIENHDVSERFLYDFRRTVAELILRNHYRRLKELAHSYGIGVHPESGGPHPAPIDALKNLGESDIPMGEFWAIANTHRVEPHRRLYIKQGASAAHIYGKRFMQAEGPTTIGPHWERDPWMLKPTMDRVFCEGMNRFVIHTFTHSPKEAGLPGNEYFAGTHINPNVTWWKQGKAFLDWTARNSLMLSQGLFVADVAFYYGDHTPNQVPLKHVDPRLGEGYDYDVVNTDVLLERMSARNGKIYLPDGMSYRVLVLPEIQAMNIQVLEKIEQMVKNGATVIGPKPETATGLRHDAAAQKRLNELAGRLWGKIDGISITENSYGKGKIVWGRSIRETLTALGTVPDFEYLSSYASSGDRGIQPAHIDYIHRTAPGFVPENGGFPTDSMEIYYIANRLERPEYLRCSFRVADRQPEIWYPENGKTLPVNVYIRSGKQTSVPLFLDPFGSVFVVFRRPAKSQPVTSIKMNGVEIFPLPSLPLDSPPFMYLPDGKLSFCRTGTFLLTQGSKTKKITAAVHSDRQLAGEWQVSFDPLWGAPASIVFPEPISWTAHADSGIKYYSGAAVYRKSFVLDNAVTGDTRFLLDLGELYHLAEVRINGQAAGVWWKKPFAGDITEWLQKGENTLEVTIVNLWPNRIIGDLFLPENRRYTKTNVVKFTKETPLLPSGLIGPVRLLSIDH
ncbi:MAG: HAD hydrolase-like protein [Bacteroidales bacterium]|jgi:HAD superfamily hydrolase (TIGR01509 family)|nr:HAD hydrolase-like protein [Bacteroidales bacterium]